MRKAIRRALIGLGAFLGLAAGAFALFYWRLSHPAYDRLPLPQELVSLESPEGMTLLEQSDAKLDFTSLTAHFQTQQKGSFCGVASAVTAVNVFYPGASLNQETFFNDCTANTRSWLQVTFGGMSLEALGGLLQCHGVKVSVHFAQDSSLEAFREAASENMRNFRDLLIVNYARGSVGQQDSGHISPVAAYHAPSDRFLILDVASYKYPPVWVKAEKLWNAMNTVDSSSGRTRGFLVLSK